MNGRYNRPPTYAQMKLGGAIIKLIYIIFLFCIVLLITPIWLIIYICYHDIGNPWIWLSRRWKEMNGDYEGLQESYGKEYEKTLN